MCEYPQVGGEIERATSFDIGEQMISCDTGAVAEDVSIAPAGTLDAFYDGDGEFRGIDIHRLKDLQALPDPLHAGADVAGGERDRDVSVRIKWAEAYPGSVPFEVTSRIWTSP